MNFWRNKYFWWSVVGVFAWIFVSDFVIHQKILKTIYLSTSQLWRTEADILNHLAWMFAGQFAIAFSMCWIFPYGYKKHGSWEGVRFGLWIGLFTCAHYFMQFAVTPFPPLLLWAWCLLTLAQSVVAGWICSLAWQWSPRSLHTSKP